MFISEPVAGTIYVAEHHHHRFRWVRYHAGVSVEACLVPRVVRVRAYKMFELDRRRNAKGV